MLQNIQVNILLCEVMDQILMYAKFMKDLLTGKRRMRDNENVILAEECSHIIQRKLQRKLIDLGRFTTPYFIGPIKFGQALCDLGVSINLMSLSMMRRLDCGKPKSTHLTLTLDDRPITHPNGIFEEVLILDMPEDIETPLILLNSLQREGI